MRKKQNKNHVPNAPKKPSSSYMLWFNDNCTKIGDEHFAELTGGDRVISIAKKAGVIWKSLCDEEKALYQAMYEEAKLEYNAKKSD